MVQESIINSKKHIDLIDYLKAVCIFMVIFTHYNWKDKTTPFFTLLIAMAVPVFMLLTSYNFSMSYEYKTHGRFTELYQKGILIPRLLRFTLPFLMIYGAELVLRAVEGQICAPKEMLFHFLEGGFGPGSYYYPILIQLLFLFPIIYLLVKRFSWLGVVAVGLVNFAYEYYVHYSEMELETYRLLVPRYFMFLAMGCYMFFHLREQEQKHSRQISQEQMAGQLEKKKHRRWSRYPLPLWCLVLLFSTGLYFILWVYQFDNQPELELFCFWTRTSMLTAWYIFPIIYLMLYLGKDVRIPGKAGKILSEIGKASYHIFLVQMLYYEFFDDLLFPAKPAVMVSLGNVVVCVIAGYGYYIAESRLCIWRKSPANWNVHPVQSNLHTCSGGNPFVISFRTSHLGRISGIRIKRILLHKRAAHKKPQTNSF